MILVVIFSFEVSFYAFVDVSRKDGNQTKVPSIVMKSRPFLFLCQIISLGTEMAGKPGSA